MHIDHLKLSNFRGFEEFEIDFHEQCTVLVGVNGTGKTSILEGVCVALGSWFLGFPDQKPVSIVSEQVYQKTTRRDALRVDLEPQYPVRVEASASIYGEDVTWARELRAHRGRTTHGEAKELKQLAERTYENSRRSGECLPILAYYGTSRLWVQKQHSTLKVEGLSSRLSGYEDCLDPASNHKLLSAWMKRRKLQHLERLDTHQGQSSFVDVEMEMVREAVQDCLGQEVEAFDFSIAHDDLLLSMRDGTQRTFSTLSDGFRNLIALVADIAGRAVRLNPRLREQELGLQSTVGVVLIDEVALHIHPAWQRDILPSLRETFPLVQFIVTTHSPLVLSSVEPECIRFLRGQSNVEWGDISKGLDANTVLSELMGVPERDPEIMERLEEVDRLIEGNELQVARDMIEELKHVLGHTSPVVTGLEWELGFANFQEDSHAHDR